MRLIPIMGIVLAGGILPGCFAHMDSRAIGYTDPGDRLYVWKSNYSAGIGTKNGVCAQAATTAKATATETGVEVGAEAMKLINPATPAGTGEKLADVGVSTTQSVMLTNATNGQTAFANIAIFISAKYRSIATWEPIPLLRCGRRRRTHSRR